MSTLRLITAATLLSLASAASASSFIATTDTLGASLANSAKASSDASFNLSSDKRIIAAQDDAAAFVASNGNLRSARLEAALNLLRSYPEAHNRTDMELAQAIAAR